MDEKLAIEMQQALGEAGGVAWCELYGHKEVDGVPVTVKINLTAREMSASLALESLIGAIKEAGEKYNMHPYNMPKKVDPFPVIERAEPVYAPVVNDVTGRTTNTNDTNQFHCPKFVSSRFPKKDGWVKIDWYSSEPGKTKFPFMSSYLPIEKALSYLRAFGFDEAKLFSGQEFTCDIQVWWKQGTEKNSAGNYYKDLVGVSQ